MKNLKQMTLNTGERTLSCLFCGLVAVKVHCSTTVSKECLPVELFWVPLEGIVRELLSQASEDVDLENIQAHCDSFGIYFANKVVCTCYDLDTMVGLVQIQYVVGV